MKTLFEKKGTKAFSAGDYDAPQPKNDCVRRQKVCLRANNSTTIKCATE